MEPIMCLSSLPCFWRILFIGVVALIIPAVQSQQPPLNHSLITYRQYSEFLTHAPKCLLDGCGAGTLTTASSPCISQSPCYGLWNIIQDQFHQDWCSLSPSDIACRIPGWPILNSTSICESVPNDWIFYTHGQCCVSGDQPFEVANWMRGMCDGSWKELFAYYGGMAKEDWEDWIMPLNWTVRPENATTRIADILNCPNPSEQLGAFAAENILLLILVGLIPYIKYRRDLARSGQPRGPRHTGIMVKITRFWNRRTGGRFGELATIQWIVVGIIIASGHIGLDFLTSVLIRRTSGYSHVPVVELAVLFGTRPRVGWVLCGLSKFDHQVFSNAAASFGLSELILQGFGSKYFGVTAHIGTQRGFYHVNQLRPFWHGRAAYRMYIGALLWLMGCFGIFLSWLIFVTLQGKFLIYCSKLKRWEEAQAVKVKSWLRSKTSEQPRYSRLVAKLNPIGAFLHRITPDRVILAFNNLKEWTEKSPVGDSDYVTINTQTPRPTDTLENLREKSIYLVLLVGLCSFSAQIVFWDGFVKAAGARYCPPSLVKIVVLWAVASVTGAFTGIIGNMQFN